MVAAHAIRALGEIGEESASPRLIALLTEGGPLCDAALDALGQLDGSDATPVLVDLLESEDPDRRRRTVRALGRRMTPGVVERLIRVLEEEGDVRVAVTVIRLLGEHRAGEAVPVLVNAMNKRPHGLGRDSVYALARIATPDAVAALEEARTHRWLAAEADQALEQRDG